MPILAQESAINGPKFAPRNLTGAFDVENKGVARMWNDGTIPALSRAYPNLAK